MSAARPSAFSIRLRRAASGIVALKNRTDPSAIAALNPLTLPRPGEPSGGRGVVGVYANSCG